MVKIHGKEYKTVAERILEVHKATDGDYSINTSLISWEDGVVIMKAELSFNDNTYTGHAYEKEGTTQINRTSALENCETSAIGRSLASAGFLGTEFASANEVENAIHQQNSSKKSSPVNLITTPQRGRILELVKNQSDDIKEKTTKWLHGEHTKAQAETMIKKLQSMDQDSAILESLLKSAIDTFKLTKTDAVLKLNELSSEDYECETFDKLSVDSAILLKEAITSGVYG